MRKGCYLGGIASSDSGLHIAKYFPDRILPGTRVYYIIKKKKKKKKIGLRSIFPARLKTVCGISQSEASWHFNSGAVLVSQTKRNWPPSLILIMCYHGLGLLYEDYHNRNRARMRHNSITCQMSNDMTGDFVFILPVECF